MTSTTITAYWAFRAPLQAPIPVAGPTAHEKSPPPAGTPTVVIDPSLFDIALSPNVPSDAPPASSKSPQCGLTLLAIISHASVPDAERVAVLNDAASNTLLFAVAGDRCGGMTVVAISEDRVTLKDADTRVRLRLHPGESP